MTTFASELERRRLAASLSQDELAVKAGVSRSTVQAAERGQRISMRMVYRLAAHLAWPVEEATRLIARATANTPRVVVSGPLAERIREAATAAGQSVDDFLADLMRLKREANVETGGSRRAERGGNLASNHALAGTLAAGKLSPEEPADTELAAAGLAAAMAGVGAPQTTRSKPISPEAQAIANRKIAKLKELIRTRKRAKRINDPAAAKA